VALPRMRTRRRDARRAAYGLPGTLLPPLGENGERRPGDEPDARDPGSGSRVRVEEPLGAEAGVLCRGNHFVDAVAEAKQMELPREGVRDEPAGCVEHLERGDRTRRHAADTGARDVR